MWVCGNSRIQLGIAPFGFPGASRITSGRKQHRVSGNRGHQRQIEASRLRKPLARFKKIDVEDIEIEKVSHLLRIAISRDKQKILIKNIQTESDYLESITQFIDSLNKIPIKERITNSSKITFERVTDTITIENPSEKTEYDFKDRYNIFIKVSDDRISNRKLDFFEEDE